MAYLVDKKTDTGIFSSAESAFHGLKVERRTFVMMPKQMKAY